jgi:hypothetical protein
VTIDIAMLLLVAVFGLGSGLSVGWILCDRARRAHPAGIEKMAQVAAQQVDLARKDADKLIHRLDARHDSEIANLRSVFSEHLRALHMQRLNQELPTPLPPNLQPGESAARVTGAETSPDTRERDDLMARGFSAEEADAIQRGELDNVPPDGLLDRIAIGDIARRTAVT